MLDNKILRQAAQAAFWAALVFAFYEAVIPPAEAWALFPWDKAEHFAAFFVLMTLAMAGFIRQPLWLLAGALAGFGAVIEVAQALPAIHRDCDFWDWVADAAAILAALAPVLASRLRRTGP